EPPQRFLQPRPQVIPHLGGRAAIPMPLAIATLRQVGRCRSCSVRRSKVGTQSQHCSSRSACCDRCDGQGSGQGRSLSGGNCAVVSPRSHARHLCSERPHLSSFLLHSY
ncbi:unnamed protein product, partial [Ectocarpus sp. 8 AP-2014]